MLWHARVVCSDEGCEAEFELLAPFEEIDTLVCDCGAGMLILGWPEPAED